MLSRSPIAAHLALRAMGKARYALNGAEGGWSSVEAGARVFAVAPLLQWRALSSSSAASAASSAHGTDAAAHEFDLAPGMLLRVTCTGAGAGLRVVNGAHDRVAVVGSRLSVERTGATIAAMEAAAGATVSIALPARFCGLTAATTGGPVELVGQLSEAPLDIKTAGGVVALQRARATDASILSGGGSVTAGELSAQRVVIRSGGGCVAFKRLFGLDIEVLTAGDPEQEGSSSSSSSTSSSSTSSSSTSSSTSSGRRAASGAVKAAGGDVELGAAYGERASIETGGGDLIAAHVSCSGLAAVDTGGGALTIEGLEGNASLLTRGGPIKVHLHERFGSCFLDSAGGDIEVLLSPGASVASLQVQAGGGIRCDPALRISGELGPTTCVGTIGGDAGPSAAAVAAGIPAAIPVAEAAAAAAAHVESARRVGALGYSTETALQGAAAWGSSSSSSSSSSSGVVWNASRLTRGGPGGVAAGSGSAAGGSKLVINAGSGAVALRSLSWMEAVALKVRARGGSGGSSSGSAP